MAAWSRPTGKVSRLRRFIDATLLIHKPSVQHGDPEGSRIFRGIGFGAAWVRIQIFVVSDSGMKQRSSEKSLLLRQLLSDPGPWQGVVTDNNWILTSKEWQKGNRSCSERQDFGLKRAMK